MVIMVRPEDEPYRVLKIGRFKLGYGRLSEASVPKISRLQSAKMPGAVRGWPWSLRSGLKMQEPPKVGLPEAGYRKEPLEA